MTSDEQIYRMTIEREKSVDSKHVDLTISSTLTVGSEDWAAISAAIRPTIRRDQSALLAMLTDAMRPWIEYERQEHGCGGRRAWLLPSDDPIPPDQWEASPGSCDEYDGDGCSTWFYGDYDGLPAAQFTVPPNRERDWCTRISAALVGIARNLDAP